MGQGGGWRRGFRWRGGGVVLLAVTLTACSSAPGAAVPEDFTTATTDAFALSYPADWEVLSQSPSELRVAAAGDAPVRPSAAATVDTAYQGGADGFDAAVDGTLTVLGNVRRDAQELAAEDVTVAGAARARLVETTFVTGEGTRVHHVDLFALSGEGRLVYARAEAPRDDADPERLRAIVTSLDVS